MATKTTVYHCDNCENGEVLLIVKETKRSTSIEVKDCNRCKKGFGIKSIQKLKIKSGADNDNR